MLGTMKVSQLVAIVGIIGGIVLLAVFKSWAARLPKELVTEGGTIPLDEETLAEAADDGPEEEKSAVAAGGPAEEDIQPEEPGENKGKD